ncbi:MAG TPA: pirin family protein, partial [bacterium]|nr:pirin family protein [bacterium]
QDIDLYASLLEKDKALQAPLRPGSGFWLQLVTGALTVNGAPLATGDAFYGEGEASLDIRAGKESHFLLFDLGPFPR